MECRNVYLYSYYYKRKCRLAFISGKTNESVADFATIVEDVVLYGYPIDLTSDEIRLHAQKNSEIIIPLYPFEIMEYGDTRPEIREKLKEAIKIRKRRPERRVAGIES
ncbi:MAG: hypothetical protein LBT42_07185 [Tannerella sp.]|jgi:hypothetical protein|nr:hypothetical protein [Tannerella sp.]